MTTKNYLSEKTSVLGEARGAEQSSDQGLQNDIDFLSDFSRYQDVSRIDFAGRLALNKNGEGIYNFGKHKGKTIKEVSESEPGYYGWMMDADFPLYTKKCLKKEMEKIKLERRKQKGQNYEAKISALKNKFK